VGPTPTLPANRQPPPTTRNRHARRLDPAANRDLVLGVAADQPPTTRPDHDRAADLQDQEAAGWLHHELAELDAGARLAERPAEDPEPLGRRLPEPLTGREGVER
jgi:hypothetical protein